jgi:hypothetical protein
MNVSVRLPCASRVLRLRPEAASLSSAASCGRLCLSCATKIHKFQRRLVGCHPDDLAGGIRSGAMLESSFEISILPDPFFGTAAFRHDFFIIEMSHCGEKNIRYRFHKGSPKSVFSICGNISAYSFFMAFISACLFCVRDYHENIHLPNNFPACLGHHRLISVELEYIVIN